MTPPDGPSLETYIETRFNLLDERIREAANVQANALNAAVHALMSALAAADLRYQQRFDAQADALAAAFQASKEATASAMAAADRAVVKAELASDKRFESVNEFRETLSDQQQTFMPRAESLALHTSASERITALKESLGSLTAERMGIKGGWGYAVGVAGLVALLVALLWKFRP